MADSTYLATIVAAFCTLLIFVGIPLYLVYRFSKRRKQSGLQQRYTEAQVRHLNAQTAFFGHVPSVSTPPPPVIFQTREVITREVVKIPCRYCGQLNLQSDRFCTGCGAPPA
jgi:hypothetical protein